MTHVSGAQTNKTDQMGQGTSAASPQEGGSGEESFRRFDLATQRDEALRAAQAAVGAGQNIVLPTDTVYGIGADAFSADAVQGLLNAKHRGRDMPPPVLIAEPAMLPALVSSIPLGAERMIKECWPGALTLILNAATALHMDLGETAGTIAVRVPDNDDARALLLHTGPLAVSSANISGQPSATDVGAAIAMLGDSVAVYLDGGRTPGPVASTIVDFTVAPAGRILRQGVIGFDQLEGLSPGLEDLVTEQVQADQAAAATPPSSSPDAPSGSGPSGTPDSSADAAAGSGSGQD
ncbi:Sua5/YciO/YrdC/YwlC [Propionibacterium freudenreichii]|uniref:L-threonylcarbamoyladenylate synthase n=1 Tax=Propionibacterium freudenreichii TaxID=1744 RepID=A0A2C8A9T6_9ACTN|nr:TRNA threonylcarbamoyladenosine biosynthesis protein YwlC [Propionibacterium freudenreichii]CDP48810.1 Sua5/YciO/YrdC/YwlC [Propionibacterium freudenreichii subsp. freudenreichii]CEG88601.1 Sua5/YciO/YrdC/YwlC [Propionibacterium freudenreichii]CEH03595.1 Sua5/YciO/YrdC/YwlC [Propionibacterium freudenreichii]CEH09978.1 Sua5/YciO/YrdC/YwlC [Propionibacterium freudenreichii]